ncbi:hypothetical protein FYJ51_01850 [Erysipelotrichaceae bacterium Oil+RF-744-GAM-WT-6]|uniref:Uncharacterized protein n=1 Tax=Stecheria intestinalis TaxID=2606630 RepID=A0A7X2NQI0_9FIRM|nr:hypothetical protein [Stecheria intestinalis]MSS57654.1 hypothetical protein [Stecheria intestinalis]
MTLKISEMQPDNVFAQLQKGIKCIAIDFERGEYIDLSGQNVSNIQRLTENENVKFFTVERSES